MVNVKISLNFLFTYLPCPEQEAWGHVPSPMSPTPTNLLLNAIFGNFKKKTFSLAPFKISNIIYQRLSAPQAKIFQIYAFKRKAYYSKSLEVHMIITHRCKSLILDNLLTHSFKIIIHTLFNDKFSHWLSVCCLSLVQQWLFLR